jgi:tetratricopeptide (TPR) repeat protein
MNGSLRVTLISSALVVSLLLASVLTLKQVDRLRTGSSLQEVLYIRSPLAIKRLSLGYHGLMADIYWTRAVQYFGGHHSAGIEQFKLLGPLLDITTYLDPHLLVAYEFGANFLAPKPPNGAGEPDKAIQLVERGIQANPDAWRLYYNLGFIYYFEKKDYAGAAKAFERGSHAAGAHPFLKILAANMAQHAGETQMSRMLWITTYESSTDKDIRANAAAHLRALTSDENVVALEKLVDLYRAKMGHAPASFVQMISAGILRGIPLDPAGQPYKLTPEGRIEVANPDDIPFVTQGLPIGYKPPSKIDPKKMGLDTAAN